MMSEKKEKEEELVSHSQDVLYSTNYYI